MKNLGLKKWEIALVAACSLIFTVSLVLYVSGKSVRRYLFPLKDEVGQEKVGQLAAATGNVRKEGQGEIEFSPAAQGSALFNQDTLVTGPDSRAKITLDDGSTLELDANAMIRLSFESRLALGGISRIAKIDVVSGKVTAQAKTRKIVLRSKDTETEIVRNETPRAIVVKKPVIAIPKVAPPKFDAAPLPNSQIVEGQLPQAPAPVTAPIPAAPVAPPPAITGIQITSPKSLASFSVPDGTQNPQVGVTFEWTLTPKNVSSAKLHFLLHSPSSDQKSTVDEVIESDADGSRSVTLVEPGDYELLLSAADQSGAHITQRRLFKVNSHFKAIQVLPPLGADSANRWTGKKPANSGITLRWNAYPGVDRYSLWFGSTANSKHPLMEKESDKPEYVLSRDELFNRSFYYRVSAELNSGFIVQSDVQSFNYSYLPPTLTLPAEGGKISKSAVTPGQDGNLFTWQKMEFTDGYEIEIAHDPSFSRVVLNQRISDNFMLIQTLTPGTYYWRVKAYNKTVTSAWGHPRKFVLVP